MLWSQLVSRQRVRKWLYSSKITQHQGEVLWGLHQWCPAAKAWRLCLRASHKFMPSLLWKTLERGAQMPASVGETVITWVCVWLYCFFNHVHLWRQWHAFPSVWAENMDGQVRNHTVTDITSTHQCLVLPFVKEHLQGRATYFVPTGCNQKWHGPLLGQNTQSWMRFSSSSLPWLWRGENVLDGESHTLKIFWEPTKRWHWLLWRS